MRPPVEPKDKRGGVKTNKIIRNRREEEAIYWETVSNHRRDKQIQNLNNHLSNRNETGKKCSRRKNKSIEKGKKRKSIHDLITVRLAAKGSQS